MAFQCALFVAMTVATAGCSALPTAGVESPVSLVSAPPAATANTPSSSVTTAAAVSSTQCSIAQAITPEPITSINQGNNRFLSLQLLDSSMPATLVDTCKNNNPLSSPHGNMLAASLTLSVNMADQSFSGSTYYSTCVKFRFDCASLMTIPVTDGAGNVYTANMFKSVIPNPDGSWPEVDVLNGIADFCSQPVPDSPVMTVSAPLKITFVPVVTVDADKLLTPQWEAVVTCNMFASGPTAERTWDCKMAQPTPVCGSTL